jgi:hypothetical protein
MYARNHRCIEALVTCAASVAFAIVHPAGIALADAFVSAPITTTQDGYTIDAHIVSAGAAQRTTNGCFRLTATIGEPAPGYSSGTHYALKGGFAATRAAAPHDDIFFDGMEDCSR